MASHSRQLKSRSFEKSQQEHLTITFTIDALDHPESSNPLAVFKPFQMVCQSGNPELITIAIDCLGKLFTYNYWKFAAGIHVEHQQQKKSHEGADEEADNDNDGTSEMITFVINTICEGFIGENTDDKVQLQIIKVGSLFFKVYSHIYCL
jgi:brefeldin A-inhibited guanine nucleotide-exchange protein